MKSEFGSKIAELRKSRNLTQAQLAREIGKSTSSIAMWETGQREPDLDTVALLAGRFNVTVNYILGLPDVVSKPETPTSIKAWLRSDNELLPNEKEQLSNELEDYFKARKQRILKDRNKER